METKQDLGEMAKRVHDKKTFIEFVIALKEDREEEINKEKLSPSSPYGPGANGWENGSIEAYLDAMSRWTDDISGTTNEEMMIPAQPSWRSFAMILYSGKIYE
jgi:hypothetical protein